PPLIRYPFRGQANQFQALLVRGVGKGDTKHCGRVGADGYFALTAVGRYGDRVPFVAEDSNSGQRRPTDRFPQRHLDPTGRAALRGRKIHTAPALSPGKLEALLTGHRQQLIHESEDAARRGSKSALEPIHEFWWRVHRRWSVKGMICFSNRGQATSK